MANTFNPFLIGEFWVLTQFISHHVTVFDVRTNIEDGQIFFNELSSAKPIVVHLFEPGKWLVQF